MRSKKKTRRYLWCNIATLPAQGVRGWCNNVMLTVRGLTDEFFLVNFL